MKKILETTVGLSLFFLIIFSATIIAGLSSGLIAKSIYPEAFSANTSTPAPQVDIHVYNPYSLTVSLEVKCDWNYKEHKFMYHKFFIIPGKKSTVIEVPDNLKKCQIWPKIKW